MDMDKRTYRTPVGSEGMYVLNTDTWRTYRPVMDKALCVNCGVCLSYCPVNSIKWEKEKGFFISYNYCKGCGICEVECPKKAIKMFKEGVNEA